MAQCFYTECFYTWDGSEGGKDGLDDNQWHIYNVTENHNIPASAVLEVACVNEYSLAEYNIGLRNTANSGQADGFRRIQLAEAEDGDNYVTMHVQLDSSGCLQYFVEHFTRLHFDILGYWLGCEYIDTFDEFDPSAPSGWENYALDQYGVGSGQVAEIVLSNTADALDHTLGVRASGSTEDRRFEIKEAESGGEECLSVFVSPSGATAGINIWSSSISDCSFRLIGYFPSPPAEYSENDASFTTPGSQNTWVELDVGVSGIPSDSVSQFCIKQYFADNIVVGVRETNSTIDNRKLDIDRQEADLIAPSRGTIHSNIDDNGKLEYYCSDISDAPLFDVIGYWDNFNESTSPLPNSNSVDLFVYGRNPYAHYIETFSTGVLSTPVDQWNILDISTFLPPQMVAEGAVAEIMIRNDSNQNPCIGGVRSIGSSLDRKFEIHESEEDNISIETIFLHVPVSVSGTIETYSNNDTFLEFKVVGCWGGAEYTETVGDFDAGATSGWTQKSLSPYGVPGNKIVEILISNSGQTMAHSGGVRAVGSSLERLVDIASLIDNYGATWEGSTYTTMFVKTSGSSASIEVYAGDDDEIDFHVVGYWNTPPGEYTELSEVITPYVSTTVWRDLDITAYNVPSGAVAEIIVGNTDWTNRNELGVRETGSILERKDSWAETNETGGAYLGVCGGRMHVNAVSGTIQTYHQRADTKSYFAAIGYWDNLSLIPTTIDDQISMYISGIPGFISTSGQYPSGVSLWIYGVQKSPDCDLFITGNESKSSSGDLYVFGVNVYKTNAEFSVEYPSGLLCYIDGGGISSNSGKFDLFTHGTTAQTASGDLFVTSHLIFDASGDLFLKTIEGINNQISLYIHNPIDSSSGLVRESDAVFYLSRRHTEWTNSETERIENIDWDIVRVIIGNSTFFGEPGATTTVGDGTLPLYNDMGGGFSSCYAGFALVGSTPDEQGVFGHVVGPSDYQYVGSGSITTAFWMSGAKTSGNIAEVGWFDREGSFSAPGPAYSDHVVGVKITSESGLQVWTSVRDLPYEQVSGDGLWWGGTTHYGTPSGSDWTWNDQVDSLYWSWNEKWSEVYINHDEVEFFVIRSDFIASGVDGNTPNHMKVWLSVAGQPWVYVGSGLTGPPASSLYSFSNPRNRFAENAVGVKVQAINYDGGSDNQSISVNEVVLWTDSDKFYDNELSDLYNVVNDNNRPLDEYKPTIAPRSTYVKRTVGVFAYNPTIPDIGLYNPGEICSGILVTLEVGIGNYGEDSSAYLIEETPPSGFYIRNISPERVTYQSQGSRPDARQQIFHDPQSGILQPYGEANTNTYGASIRWINHDNHPEKDQRRSPEPTGIYTYELYPVYYAGVPHVDDFEFTGSGIFFGGSTGSGTFIVETTNDTSGTTSGLTGRINNFGHDLYISGPNSVSGNINLYLRAPEVFTSMYIGTTNRTPEVTDFTFIADGEAAIDSMPGVEYGPPLYLKGPLRYENSISLVTVGPAGDDIPLFIRGWDTFNTSGDYPSGLSLNIGDGHEVFYGSGNLFALGPVPYSGSMYMHTRAGVFEPSPDLFIHGYTSYASAISGFIKGPEFICTSGDFEYPLDSDLFTYPSGGKSPDFYIKGPEFICSSGSFTYPHDVNDFQYPYGDPSPELYMQAHATSTGTCPLYIGPLRLWENWTLYLKTEDNNPNKAANLFTHGFDAASGTNQSFNNFTLYLEAADADYPYTAGGTESWNMFLKAQSGNLTDNEAWTMFLKADTTTVLSCDLHTYGHASGEQPHGNEINSSLSLMCSVNPDDPRRIGYTPFDSDDDPWTLFLKCEPGHFGVINLYVSGTTPIYFASSGNLFIEGLFEQDINDISLYIMGISGIFNNGPGGLHLFIDASTLVYNTSGNMYTHGY